MRVWLNGQDEETVNRFIDAVRDFPQVMECHLMAGDCDFLLRVAVADLDAYRQFQIKHLNRIKGAQASKRGSRCRRSNTRLKSHSRMRLLFYIIAVRRPCETYEERGREAR
jgi:DNA-binding Lrp family transcriptional regulator